MDGILYALNLSFHVIHEFQILTLFQHHRSLSGEFYSILISFDEYKTLNFGKMF